jgi:hypothetical protein
VNGGLFDLTHVTSLARRFETLDSTEFDLCISNHSPGDEDNADRRAISSSVP